MSTFISDWHRAASAGETILKVVHAGEHGAVNIYRGQQWASFFRGAAFRSELEEFRLHEVGHRAIFAEVMRDRRLLRCRSFHLCGLGGLLLGLVTGLLGRKAIGFTTVAVERTVLAHLARYRVATLDRDADIHAALGKIVSEEQEHYDVFAGRVGSPTGLWRILVAAVTLATEAVIRMGIR